MLGIKRNTDWEVIYELLNIQIYLGVYEHEPVIGKKEENNFWLTAFIFPFYTNPPPERLYTVDYKMFLFLVKHIYNLFFMALFIGHQNSHINFKLIIHVHTTYKFENCLRIERLVSNLPFQPLCECS